MRKVFILLSLTILVLGCNTKHNKTTERIITVSLAPQKFFLQKIVGDFAIIHVLVPSGVNPETYDPTPMEIAQLENSEAYFMIGTLPFEHKWVASLSNTLVKVNQATFMPHELIHACDDHQHVHIHGDPHYWTSLTGAKAMAEVMLSQLIEIYPDQKQLFMDNYSSLTEIFDHISSLAQDVFADKEDLAFVIYHPSLSLFAEEWGLHQLVIEENGIDPSPRHIINVIDRARELDTRVIMIQEEYDQKNALSISKELQLPVLKIQPLAENWTEEMKKIICAFDSE